HDDFLKELKVFATSQILIKSKLSNSYFDVIIYVERVQVKEKFDEEKFKKLASLSTNMIIRRSNLTRMFIANEWEREYSFYDLIIKYERSNQ
uniref:Uncharacterized protein n=1 Tax=Acrobeloides nanus TaxID=290746 RepID=A0A914D6W3_9BILA